MTVTATASTILPATGAAKSPLDQTAIDFNLFLKLLTTQMQNQDPLKPMDSTEYTAQLAQFTQVQQTVKQTSTLDEILAQLGAQNLAQASGFIGKTAQFDSAVAGLSADRPAVWAYTASAPITGLTAKVTDSSGRTVATSDVAPNQSGSFTWNGRLATGQVAPEGAYSLTLTGTTETGATVPVSITTSGRVDEVMGVGGALTLGVNGAPIPVAKLIKLTG